jgi:hypothetical protein
LTLGASNVWACWRGPHESPPQQPMGHGGMQQFGYASTRVSAYGRSVPVWKHAICSTCRAAPQRRACVTPGVPPPARRYRKAARDEVRRSNDLAVALKSARRASDSTAAAAAHGRAVAQGLSRPPSWGTGYGGFASLPGAASGRPATSGAPCGVCSWGGLSTP